MQLDFSELPLALFTTCAPIGAGAFVMLAIVVCTCTLSEERLAKLERMMLVPFCIALVGFVCAFFHLKDATHVLYAVTGLGSSPLTNEVFAGAVFMAAAAVYLVLVLAGKLGRARRPLAIVVAVLAVVFACFMGIAYLMETVASWNSPLTLAALFGYLIAGGGAGFSLAAALAKVSPGELAPARNALIAVTALGAVLALVGLLGQLALVAGSANAVESGAELAASVTPAAAIAAVLIAIAAAEVIVGLAKRMHVGLAASSVVIAAAGILLARLVFYTLYLSVGVTLM